MFTMKFKAKGRHDNKGSSVKKS